MNSSYTILQNIPLSFDQNRVSQIQDIININDNTFIFYDQKWIGLLQNLKLKKVFKNILPYSEEIKKVEYLNKDLIAVGSINRIIIFSIKTGKILNDISQKKIQIQSFIVWNNNNTIFFANNCSIYKINIFQKTNNIKESLVLRTNLEQPICKISKQNKDDIIIQTYYENVIIYNIPTNKTTRYYYYDLPSRLFTDCLALKNDIIVSYSKGKPYLNRMNLKNGSNQYIQNDQIIHQVKVFDEEDQKNLIFSFYNGRVGVYQRKTQREVAAYQDDEIRAVKNSVYSLKDDKILIINPMYARLIQLEIVERNYCTFF